MMSKKKQRLLEKAKTRPDAEVMKSAPCGAANINTAPKLSDFKNAASQSEQRRLHAIAVHEFMQNNMTRRAIEEETRLKYWRSVGHFSNWMERSCRREGGKRRRSKISKS